MKLGEVLDHRYRLLGELGRGGFGTVWKAFDERLQRQVAVKILFRGTTQAGWNKAAVRFWQEAITAGRLSSEHIVIVHDFGRTMRSETPYDYLVMELLEGRPLSQIVSAGALPLHQALSWAGQISAALEAAHQAGVIHRDIKPPNVIVNEGTSRLKVVDFGIAKNTALPLSLTAPGTVVGSVMYMAPERAGLRSIIDERSDLYSLGCVLHELLTGYPPFFAPHATPAAILHCHAQQSPLPPSVSRHEVPEVLDRLVLELLAKDPAARPAKATEVRERLAAMVSVPTAASSAPGLVHPTSDVERALRRRVQSAVDVGDRGAVLRAHNLMRDISKESKQLLGVHHACTFLARLEQVRLQGELDSDRGLAGAVELMAECKQALGPTDPLTLRSRSLLGHLTDEIGRPDRARALLASIIDDCTAHLGSEALETLEARTWHAGVVLCLDNYTEALSLSSQLMYDCQRTLGPVHPLTLCARFQYAVSTLGSSGPVAANVFYIPVLADAVTHLGEDSSVVLRHQLLWQATTFCIDALSPTRAKYEIEILLPCVIRNWGENAGPTFITRAAIAAASASEDLGNAVDQLASLITHCSAALGPKSTTTLLLRRMHANFIASVGNVGKARDLMKAVLVDLEGAIGSGAPVLTEMREEAENWA